MRLGLAVSVAKTFVREHGEDGILQRVLYTLGVQGGAQALAILLSVLLAQNLSLADFGEYSFGFNMATLIATVSCLGAGPMLAKAWGALGQSASLQKRRIAVYRMQNAYMIKGAVLILGSVLVFWLICDGQTERLAFLLAGPLFVVMMLSHFFVATDRVAIANTIQFGRNAVLVLAVAVFVLVDMLAELVLAVVICSFILAAGLMLATGRIYTFNGDAEALEGDAAYTIQHWISVLLVHTDIIVVRSILGVENVAVYSVALFLSSASSFGLYAINSNTLARISDHIHNMGHDECQERITRYARLSACVSIAMIICVLVAGPQVVSLYGDAYADAYSLFCILAIGQVVNVFSGSVGLILNMLGMPHSVSVAIGGAVGIKILMSLLLVPFMGMYGVAIASTLAMAGWNVALVVYLMRSINLNSTPFTLEWQWS